jgi:predicted amidohydrolase YtcJ
VRHVNVVAQNPRIAAVQSVSASLRRGTRKINGRGKFLIPGLWDAHVHLTKAGVLSLPLFVANGVTGVRDMGSDYQEVSAWRAPKRNPRLLRMASGPLHWN